MLLFRDVIKIKDFDFDNILLDQKSYENILVYDFSYKTLMGAKLLHIRFDKADQFIRVFDRTGYLVLVRLEKHVIYNKIRYLARLKSGITYAFSYHFGKNKIGSDDDLSLEETLILHTH